MYKSIAIDGPAGAGKTTVAKALAKELGFVYVDTGAMYRTIALYIQRNQISMDQLDHIETILQNMDMKIVRSGKTGEQIMKLGDEDVSSLIRTEEIGKLASDISKHPKVRAAMTEMQRAMARVTDVVMEGRDITSVVLPNATKKFYLTASAKVRASRRMLQLGRPAEDFEQILQELKDRDEQDMNRPIAPLRSDMADFLLDSTNMSIEEVLSVMRVEIERC